MSELRLVKKSLSAIRLNVLFIHGLHGDAKDTWQSQSVPPEFWPSWLVDDLDGVSVWTVGYPVNASHWIGNGYAMAIQDRAANLLPLILAKPELRTGEIAFVGHSMGGLIIKQMIRTAEGHSRSRQDAMDLLSRTRRVAFVATPHQGSDKATLIDKWRIILRPTIATTGLIKSNPHLRDLNLWYRGWVVHQKMEHLILAETRALGKFGVIVDRESSDPGINVDPIPLDEDHSSICKPPNREAPIYILLKDFLTSAVVPPPPSNSAIVAKIEVSSQRLSDKLDDLTSSAACVRRDMAELIEISQKPTIHTDSKLISLINDEVSIRLTRIRKSRFYPTFERKEHAKKLSEDIISGHLSSANHSVRAVALAWCSRIIGSEDLSLAKDLCQRSFSIEECTEAKIAKALIMRIEGEYSHAIAALLKESSPALRGTAFMITVLENKAGAVDWLRRSQISASMLDSDGKLYLILTLLEQDLWSDAFAVAGDLSAEDFANTPALFYTAGLATLGAAIPQEFRSAIMQGIPFGLLNFPLGDAVADVFNRTKARELFYSAALAARELGCPLQEGVYLDLHLWLMLRDPKTFSEGMVSLKSSLSDAKDALRRVNFIADFGLRLDIPAIEREIERQEAMSSEASTDIAVARLVISMNQDEPAVALRYLRRYKDQLLSRIAQEMIHSIELQMLIRSDDLEGAEQLIEQLSAEGAAAQQVEKYRNLLLEASDQAKGIENRIKSYSQSSKLAELAALVQVLYDHKDWPRSERVNEFETPC